MTLYALKPRFQAALRPRAAWLAGVGVTANQITVAAAVGSLLAGAAIAGRADARPMFLIVPVWLFARMALNAMDGMLAREFGQKSVLGGYLNEVGDVVSDAALYSPFALIEPFTWPSIGLLIGLSIMTEFAGVLGPGIGASRRYDGPMGKSDRAVVFGALGLWVGSSAPLPSWIGWSVPILAALLVVTVINRIRAGIEEAESAGSPQC